jgi:hypothetical protein
MNHDEPRGPCVAEINARIAEAVEYGNRKEAAFARWQKRWLKRRWAVRMQGKRPSRLLVEQRE